MTDVRSSWFASMTVFALLLIGCQEPVAAPASDVVATSSSQSSSQRGQGTEQAATEATLAQQLNAVRTATRKYRDVADAREDGYVPISPFVPGMGFHYSDRTPPFGTALEEPPVLVYFPTGRYDPAPGEALDPAREDDLVLGAVEYLVGGDRTADPPDIFADEDSPAVLNTTEEEGWHFEDAENFTGLHAWVHRGNPEGVFHSTNPTIR